MARLTDWWPSIIGLAEGKGKKRVPWEVHDMKTMWNKNTNWSKHLKTWFWECNNRDFVDERKNQILQVMKKVRYQADESTEKKE